MRRGVTPAAAAELARAHPASRIRPKLDVFDWLSRRDDPRIARNPAGYLVRSIQQDYSAPKGYESDLRRQAERDRLLEKERTETERQARREAERRRFEERWQREWNGRSEQEREAIREAVLERHPYLAKTPHMLETKCLEELARRAGAGPGDVAE